MDTNFFLKIPNVCERVLVEVFDLQVLSNDPVLWLLTGYPLCTFLLIFNTKL